jgi:hypothetical protein
MIHLDSLSQPWIDAVAAKLGKIDKALLEKCIRALFLTEQLRTRGLQFQFKGGTSLLLHFSTPRRFSIDVDIVTIDDATTISGILDDLVLDGLFERWEEDIRTQHNQDLPVQHFKCYYSSHYPGLSQSNYVLLDVIYQTALPNWTELKPVEHGWLKIEGTGIEVNISTKEGLLGDKLTAFAPTTTGILYAKKRPLEIIKQLYDIGALFEVATDFLEVSRVFTNVALQEITYRNLSIQPEDVLDDAFQAALTICDRDEKVAEFLHLKTGITNIRPHIFQRFIIDDAIVAAAKVMYLTTLLKQKDISAPNRFSNAQEVTTWNIDTTDYNRFNRFKRTNPEAFFYVYQAYLLLFD